MNTPFNVSIPGQIALNLATGEPLSFEEQEALVQFMTSCELESLNLMPNFQFKYWSGPSGFSASVPMDRLVNADLLRSDLFRVISAAPVKMGEHQWGQETSKDIEGIRSLFPLQSAKGPSLREMSQPHELWLPCLGGRQTSVALCSRVTRDSENRQVQEYYIVCHTSLPDDYLNDIQEALELISEGNYEFKKSFNQKNGNPRPDIKPVTYEALVQPGGLLHTAREIAIVNNQRIMDLFALMTGLNLDIHVSEQKSIEWPVLKADKVKSILDSSDNIAKFDMALNWWPKGIPIFPFSVLPHDPSLKNRLPPKDVQGFPIGALLTHYKKEKPDLFEKMCAKYHILFQLHPRVFEPPMRTIYNTYSLGLGHMFHFHSMCAPTTHDFLMYEGVDLGYKIFSHKSLHLPDWKNAVLDSFPAAFPFKEENMEVKEALVHKCFTPTKGGSEEKNRVPEQLLGKTIGVETLQLARRILLFSDPIQLHPEKIFLSPETFNILSFPGDANNYY